ncbi:MAG TPA: AAA family ATPase [Thermoanaerobaculia bacterium]|nr:AAA family ATPase [Thermoanaerobaculia bacterium]
MQNPLPQRNSIDRETGEPAPAAYVSELTVRNVRCFGSTEQTLRLTDADGRPASWTVILGENGVGKTTLLQCLVALEPRRHFYSANRGDERPQVELPINGGEWNIYRDPDAPFQTEIRGRLAFADGRSSAEYQIVGVNVPTSWARVPEEPLPSLAAFRCCAYGATRRTGSPTLSERTSRDPTASLFSDYVNLVDAEEWLLVEDYARTREISEPQAELRLGRVKAILIDLLPDVSALRVARRRSRTKGRARPAIEVLTPYGWVSLSELSLGYRTMIAWAVDFASRLFELYPDSPNPLAEPAVVLVDEVDLHLHPTWQRQLRSHLTERFPRTQFVVTAHSPLVVQASENENIVVLRREGDHVVIDNDVETVRGWRIDQVLTSDLFGLETARPPEYDRVIAQRNELLNRRHLDPDERRELKHLEASILELPAGESPEDQKAMEVIRRAAAKLQERGGG